MNVSDIPEAISTACSQRLRKNHWTFLISFSPHPHQPRPRATLAEPKILQIGPDHANLDGTLSTFRPLEGILDFLFRHPSRPPGCLAHPWFTFRFADDRIIPRFHFEVIKAGLPVSAFKIESGTGERLGLLATEIVGSCRCPVQVMDIAFINQ